MFTRIRGSYVESDEGFRVSLTCGGCDGLFILYEECGKTMEFNVYLQQSASGKYLAAAPILLEIPQRLKWSLPNEDTISSLPEKERIVENIKKALKFMGEEFIII